MRWLAKDAEEVCRHGNGYDIADCLFWLGRWVQGTVDSVLGRVSGVRVGLGGHGVGCSCVVLLQQLFFLLSPSSLYIIRPS